MDIYPAIDLIGGRCVRLTEGDFAACRTYDAAPLDVVRAYEEAGAAWLHLIDLDGARDAKNRQTALIADLVKNTRLKVQTGGGIRSLYDVQRLLDLGVKRVILGSLCVKDAAATKAVLETCGKENIVLALDVRGDFETGFFVATAGWQKTSPLMIESLMEIYDGLIEHILCTDISRDGKLQGTNVTLYRYLTKRWPQFRFQASGGIADLNDIDELKEIGVAAAITGKALYEDRFTLREALERAA